MKKYFYIIAATLLISISCEDTNENLVQERGAAIVPLMSEVLPAFFTENIEASYVQFDLALSPGDQIDKAEIEVVRARGNKSGILKALSLPVTGLKVTASEILSALNIPESDFLAGDVYNLYVLTTKGGLTTRSKAAVGIPVVCYFDPSMLVGNYYYESASWDEEGEVTLEADPDDPYKIYVSGMAESQGLTGNGNKLVLIFNPNSFTVSGPKVIIADDLSDWGLDDYTNHAYEPVSGKFDSCAESYTVIFDITIAQGGWGNFSFIFTKL